MYIAIKRICEVNAPLDIFAEAGNDWTHFAHLHRKSHLEFRLLYKNGVREIFYYRARTIYPLPFFTPFIVFREYHPEQRGYRQVYLDLKSGRVHYLNGKNEQHGENVLGTGEFWFQVSWYWKYFPGLFAWLFKKRMRSVMNEDNVMIRERISLKGMDNANCAPALPERFDFFEDMMKNGYPETPFLFSDHAFEDVMKGAKKVRKP